ncbi:sulfatase [Paenibacillus thalictri]|uniref:DUF4976 domain-containing protein n=1 Tax=Paenibacillus thalictri TaxID=2527873 RepID=A0A4Q9DQF8_9BACL|nr:sulfatase-like hydrolase/transferase [Paenibacillus thalictri]TBL75643.1 DUF4976 domain-containing protein [Paenibacillus thalictri]
MNILIITVDQLRWDALSCAGNKEIRTPNMDRLCRNGTRFVNAFTNAPACMPARSSMLTGRFPHAHGVRGGGVKLSEAEITFPQIVSQNGYHTAHIGKLHVQNHTYRDHTVPHPSYGYRTLQVTDERGTYRDPYLQWVERNYPEYAEAVRVEPGAVRVSKATDQLSAVGQFPAKASHSRWVSETSIDFLRKHGQSPFMLWTSFFDPHSPYTIPNDLQERYDPYALSLPFQSGATPENENEIRRKKANYYTLVSHVDDCIGDVLDYLEASGLSETTAVILSSDHGDFVGDYGRWGKGKPEDPSVRIPMIVKVPGIGGGPEEVDDIVQLFDIAPTVCDLTGCMKPASMQARSLLPLIRHGKDPQRAPFALIEFNFEVSRINAAEVFEKTLRSSEYRLTVWSDGREGALFDLRKDPYQLNNIWNDPDYKATRDELILQLLYRLIETENTLPARTNPF